MKNTKNTKNKIRFANKLILKSTIALTVLATACASLVGGFSRGAALSAIEQDSRFKSPATMSVDVGWLPNARGYAWKLSPDDTVEAAAIRAKADFMKRQPQLDVAEQLGYIKVLFENPKLGENDMNMPPKLWEQKLGTWEFDVRSEMTDKGRKLWQDLGFEVNEKSLPLAIRNNAEVTGVTDESQTLKRVEFKYKWNPTDLGAAFDERNPAFSKLPEQLQKTLQKPPVPDLFGGGGGNLMDFTSPRGGVARFQKFDDGWRMFELYL